MTEEHQNLEQVPAEEQPKTVSPQPVTPRSEPAPKAEPAPMPTPPTFPRTAKAEPAQEEPAKAPAPTPAPTPAPAPAARPAPAPEPVAPAPPTAPTGVAQVAVAAPSFDAEQAGQWGRVDDDGTVWVKEESGERAVGQFPDASKDEALSFYVQRFLDIEAEIRLAEARLPQLGPRDVDTTLSSLAEQVAAPAAVGDLQALRDRVQALKDAGAERKKQAAAEREAAKKEAVERRENIVARAEKIAAKDPQKVQWRQSGQQIRALLDEWKEAQRRGPRLDRPTEDALWKRFSHARTTFDRHRRQFFSELDSKQKEVKAKKEELITRASEMANSTDWGRTTTAYRALMDEWKAAGRSNRKEDDELWKRFRAAQQVFFDARNAANAQTDQEQQENLTKKRALCERAEAILPVTDPKRARAALRPIQDEWEQIGFVPRNAMSEVEVRMRKVEDAIREAEQEQWRATDPEVTARKSALATQIEESLAKLDEDIAAATSAGNDAKVKKLQEERAAKQAWLDTIS
ncbi:DUF349 domain-containing protein [Bowdeniella nasicola]|uniref:DUF349 domain-containing protein n=1 Tax=Bowdeniella nasicola TaxID=208480 RepID=UPI000ADE7F96|nr:DUF349 domain-containing protein [Bowdeniella nasicola]